MLHNGSGCANDLVIKSGMGLENSQWNLSVFINKVDTRPHYWCRAKFLNIYNQFVINLLLMNVLYTRTCAYVRNNSRVKLFIKNISLIINFPSTLYRKTLNLQFHSGSLLELINYNRMPRHIIWTHALPRIYIYCISHPRCIPLLCASSYEIVFDRFMMC